MCWFWAAVVISYFGVLRLLFCVGGNFVVGLIAGIVCDFCGLWGVVGVVCPSVFWGFRVLGLRAGLMGDSGD